MAILAPKDEKMRKSRQFANRATRGTENCEYENARERQRLIGEKLRQLFDDVVSEPVPDEFLKLLEDADRGEREDEETDRPDASRGR